MKIDFVPFQTQENQSAPQMSHRKGRGRTAGAMPVWNGSAASQKTQRSALSAEMPSLKATDPRFSAFSEKAASSQKQEMGFKDIIDMVNPLHHIPVVGQIYRDVSGDEIKPPARVIGGGIFGGPVGAASAMVNVIVEDQTGRDVPGHVMHATGLDKALPSFSRQDSISQAFKAEGTDALKQRVESRFESPQSAPGFARADNLDIAWNNEPDLRTAHQVYQNLSDDPYARAAQISKPSPYARAFADAPQPFSGANEHGAQSTAEISRYDLDALPARQPVTRLRF